MKLPRPHRSHFLSTWVRKVFERRWINKALGVPLAFAMVMVPFVGELSGTAPAAHSIDYATDTFLTLDTMEPEVRTEPRTFVVPVDRLRYISTRFSGGHPGYDFASYIDDPVRAFTSGTVVHAAYGATGYGRYVILDHGHGLLSLYAHLDQITVKPGDQLDTGEELGTVGMTGYTTGPHVHFEIHDQGTAVSPYHYLDI